MLARELGSQTERPPRIHASPLESRLRWLVTGLPGSGLETLSKVLREIPGLDGFRDESGRPRWGEDLQSVFPNLSALGGPGILGRCGRAEGPRPGAEGVEKASLIGEWSRFAPPEGDVFDASPSHVVRLETLAALFPRARLGVLIRHPLEVAFAVRAATGVEDWPLDDLVEHWLDVHGPIRSLSRRLSQLVLLDHRRMRRDPQGFFEALAGAWRIGRPPGPPRVLGDAGDDAWACLANEPPEALRKLEALEPELRRHGFTLAGPERSDPLPGVGPRRPRPAPAPSPRPRLPKRWLAISLGTRGDIQPVVALGKALEARGHSIRLLSTEDHRALVEGAGLELRSVGEGSRFLRPEHFEGDGESQLRAFFAGLAESYEAYADRLVEILREEASRVDGFLVGSCVFFRELLREELGRPVVNLGFAPHAVGPGTGDDPALAALAAYGESFARHAHAATAYGIEAALDRAYARAGVRFRHRDPGGLSPLMRMKGSLSLNAFPSFAGADLPGMEAIHTGFFHLPNPARDPELEAWLEAGPPPVCVNFGSMPVFGRRAFADELLKLIDRRRLRAVIVGEGVPDRARRFARVLRSANHDQLFPRSALVVHHGGAGTTAAVARAGVPSVVVPVLEWSDQPLWGDFVEAMGAGLRVRDPAELLPAVERALEEPALRRGARALALRLHEEGSGTERAVDAIEAHFASSEPPAWRSLAVLGALDASPLPESQKVARALPVLLDDGRSSPGRIDRFCETLVESLQRASSSYPAYKSDWPKRQAALDADRADLPHDEALHEWWYFHAHLETESGRPLSVFSALFERAGDEERLGHVHASVLDLETGAHRTSSIADPRAPAAVAPALRRARPSMHLRRALAEVFAKGEVPLPDVKSSRPFRIARDRFDFEAGPLRIFREGGAYRVVHRDEEVVFDLRFVPTKPIVRNGVDGVVQGPSSADAMFYYSYTRMRVEGTVERGGRVERVSGSGWYDHEFGGDLSERGRSGSVPRHAWTWFGLQLEDDTELVLAHLESRAPGASGEAVFQDEGLLVVDPHGQTRQVRGRLEPRRRWTSVRTFVEYDTAWRLVIPALDLDLSIEAPVEGQELVSAIADPAYWEGRVHVEGARAGAPIRGVGFCEQVGRAGDREDYRSHLARVSREVARQVDALAPFDLGWEGMRDLAADVEFESILEGVPPDVFVETLVRPVRSISDRGGKGWRSMGFALCADAVGGDPERLRRFLAFPEILHTGSLIVDDIEDASTTRRGGPACHVQFGLPIALNAGNAAYFVGERFIRELDLPEERKLRLYKLYFTCMRAAHTGQGLDILGLRALVRKALDGSGFEPVWARLLAIHRLKSGVPAMIAARIGAVIGGGSTEEEDALGDYFLQVGLAFQLVDDVINLSGFSGGLKERGEDLRARKITAPLVHAFRVLPEEGRAELWRRLEAPEVEIEPVLALLEEARAMRFCHEEAHRLVEAAWSRVDAVLSPSAAKVALRAFGRFVVDVRDY